jgi:hypothetical protein
MKGEGICNEPKKGPKDPLEVLHGTPFGRGGGESAVIKVLRENKKIYVQVYHCPLTTRFQLDNYEYSAWVTYMYSQVFFIKHSSVTHS